MRCAACGRRISEWRDRRGNPDPRGVCGCPGGAVVHGLYNAEVEALARAEDREEREPRERVERSPIMRTEQRALHGQTVTVKVCRPRAARYFGPGNMRRWIRWERTLTRRDDPDRAGQVIRCE